MARHSDTWVFNIDSAVWDECLGHTDGDDSGEGGTATPPRFGFTDEEDVSPEDFRPRDIVLARIVSDDSGIGAVLEVDTVVSADEATDSVSGRDFDWIVYCDIIQDEFNSIYRENWERFAEVSNTDIQDVKTLASKSIVNLRPTYKQTYISGLLEHDSVTEEVRDRLENTGGPGRGLSPSIWIEKTEIEGREYKQAGDLQLGNAIYSPSQDKQGRDMYATMREAEVGDIVLHLLQEKGQIVGLSVIDSELETDFEGLPEFGWTDDQKGYRRWLAGYHELDDPLDIYDDVLDRQRYKNLLDTIREEYSNIFYDKNRSLVQGGYFTQCPESLADILAAESPELREEFKERGYLPESPLHDLDSADEYDELTDLTKDIEERIERAHGTSNWLRDRLAEPIVRDWSRTLSELNTGEEIGATDVAKLRQIQALYDEYKSELEAQAERIQSGTFKSLSPGPTLFIALFRLLEAEAGVTPNLNAERFKTVRDEQFSAVTPRGKTDSSLPDHPLLEHIRKTNADIYKFTAPPDYWLTAYSYAAISFGESTRDLWADMAPGDVVLFHSRSEPAWEALDSQESCILGAGIVRQPTTKPENEWWWFDEAPNSPEDQSFPYLITFDRLYTTGNVDAIDFSRTLDTKDIPEVNTDLANLTANAMPFGKADRICKETSDTGFPRHRTLEPLDTPSDSEPGITLTNALTNRLQEIPPIAIHRSFTGELDTEHLLKGLHFPDGLGESIIQQIEAALHAGDHIILTGPPGTGKTEIADRVATYLAETYPYLYSGAELTTATADWSTFDTVGGYMPTETSEDEAAGDLVFKPGIILNRLKDSQTGSQTNEPIIIDELNRADIDKGFGQLFTLLSGQSVQLPYTLENREIELLASDHLNGLPKDHQYAVPDSWRIFATMNTYDKTSLYEMSYAFMRRFAFIRVPAPDLPPANDEEAGDALADIMRQYVSAWDGIDPSDEELRAVGQVWAHTNHAVEERAIGPAIVRDLLSYITARHTAGDELSTSLTEAVVSYIFPQLEGVRERTQIVSHIADVDVIDRDMLAAAARDMLQVSLTDS